MNDNKENLFLELPIIPLRGIVVFPKMVLHFDVGRRKSVKALQKAMDDDQRVFLVCQKDASVDEPNIDDMYVTGVICNIRQMMRIPGSDNMRVVVETPLYIASAADVGKGKGILYRELKK